ncbi:MAG TPA: hypothetical protein VGN81_24755 [Pseudonocardiaceae bacterium]|jgi:hypothetical protein
MGRATGDDDGEASRDATTSGNVDNDISGTVYGPVVQARQIGAVHFHTEFPAPLIPQALPKDVRAFVNRSAELARLDEWVAQAHQSGQPAFALVTGVGGVGKTCTAVHWAHATKARFPGGQLYADLRGSAPSGPVHPHEVLGQFLRLLGCPATEVPATEDERAARFRSMVADRDIVIVLDDAASATQVRSLLPAGPRAVVVVTSRARLDDLLLEEFRLLTLDPLELTTAVDLLITAIDATRATAEPDALHALARLCDRLPLALRIAAGQLLTRHRGPVSRYVQRLSDGRELLAALAVGHDRLIEQLFDASYRDLDDEGRRAYRLLALWPGPDLSVPAAAALLDRSEDDAELLAEALVGANLLNAAAEGRYQYHSLVRRHARAHAEQTEPAELRRAAIGRAVDWYLRFAVARDRLLSDRPRLNTDFYAEAAADPVPVGDALAELDDERGNLFAAVLAADEYDLGDRPWQLGEALFMLYLTYDYYPDWLDTHRLGVLAAQRVMNRRAEMRMLSQLGSGYFAVRDNTRALRSFTESGRVAADIGDELGAQSAWEWRSFIHEARHEYSAMLDCLLASRTIAERLPDDLRPRALALSDMHVGRALKDLGRFDDAIGALRAAEGYFSRQQQESGNLAKTLTTLGQAILGSGRAADAEPVLRLALTTFGPRAAPTWQVELLAALADAVQQLGDPASAEEYRARAAAIEAVLGDRRAAALRDQPGDVTE